jgi:hypothetical protein
MSTAGAVALSTPPAPAYETLSTDEDVLRFYDKTPLTLQKAASDALRDVKLHKDPIPPADPIARSGIAPREKTAVALGGLAGNNAHGAGFLEALRRAQKRPALMTFTSGQLYWVSQFLLGRNLETVFNARLEQPFRSEDANMMYRLTFGLDAPIRPSVFEFPFDLAQTLHRSWSRFVTSPTTFSFTRELLNVWPARSLVPSGLNFEEIAAALMGETEIGLAFNAYNFREGCEIVYLNRKACDLMHKSYGANKNRPWITYSAIDEEAVRAALKIYEYGFAGGSQTLDGAYLRGIILSELPDEAHNAVDRIAVIRPQADAWIGDAPLSWVEMKDMQTEVNLNGSYYGERERIRMFNHPPPGVTAKRHVTLLELPLRVQRGWLDYILEDPDIFRDAYWRGEALCAYL